MRTFCDCDVGRVEADVDTQMLAAGDWCGGFDQRDGERSGVWLVTPARGAAEAATAVPDHQELWPEQRHRIARAQPGCSGGAPVDLREIALTVRP